MKKTIFSTAIFSAILMILTATSFAQQIVGGYSTASTDDQKVVAAAKFAVGKRTKTVSKDKKLKLDKIETAEMQVVAGLNYKLCLSVSNKTVKQFVKTIVYQNLKQKYSLTSWEIVEKCGEESNEANSGNETSAFSKCSGDQISLRETDGEADIGGKRYKNFLLTNISSNSCSISGFPKISLLNKSGKNMKGIEIKYQNDFFSDGSTLSDEKLEPINLEPKQTAWFQIYYNDGMAMDAKKPFPVSEKIKISVPDANREFDLNSSIQACCGVKVSSFRSGLPN